MTVVKETLEELEKGIGLAAAPMNEHNVLLRIAASGICKVFIQRWLIRQGLPEKAVNAASDTSLSRAYCHKPYLISWRNRVNPSFALLDSSEDEDDAFYDAALDRAREMANTSPKPEPPAPQTMTKAETEAWLKDLFKQVEKTVADLTNEKLAKATIKLDEGAKFQIRDLAKAQAKTTIEELSPPRKIEIFNHVKNEVISIGLQHELFPKLLRACQARTREGYHLNIWLTGPTGSGKTFAAKAIAQALGYEFEAESSLDADYKITGHRGPNGDYYDTSFFRRFTKGGVMLLDEVDNFSSSALLAVNPATSNNFFQFPHGHFQRHKDCIIIACANTWGLGATNEFVGRTRLDAASLDRFQPKIHWTIDERLERAVAEQHGGELGLDWHDFVLKTRRSASKQGLKIIISPRATFAGISLLQQGFTDVEVIEMTIAAGLSPEQAKAIGVDPASNRPFADRREVA